MAPGGLSAEPTQLEKDEEARCSLARMAPRVRVHARPQRTTRARSRALVRHATAGALRRARAPHAQLWIMCRDYPQKGGTGEIMEKVAAGANPNFCHTELPPGRARQFSCLHIASDQGHMELVSTCAGLAKAKRTRTRASAPRHRTSRKRTAPLAPCGAARTRPTLSLSRCGRSGRDTRTRVPPTHACCPLRPPGEVPGR